MRSSVPLTARLWLHTLVGAAGATIAILPVLLRWRPLGPEPAVAPVTVLRHAYRLRLAWSLPRPRACAQPKP
ncbi:MAG TPA: hypothetical protein VGQ78_09760 [Vicinamibacteria bacterium]|jgi:hypothetical protein|nr:hypothetical protein [Vicinamibacteria bacterium]